MAKRATAVPKVQRVLHHPSMPSLKLSCLNEDRFILKYVGLAGPNWASARWDRQVCSQHKYVLDVLKETEKILSKPMVTPVDCYARLDSGEKSALLRIFSIKESKICIQLSLSIHQETKDEIRRSPQEKYKKTTF